ncbi:Hypothetical predicted protein [Lecanosticta acicola]|uniref:Uncharacterized protein n=1 Tax=Lecanosticta acicola TaxID=111012 RepID=A0AAI8W269_9PEZI|nr:Hypothetical predicted protein [Lecanosticta acicola]
MPRNKPHLQLALYARPKHPGSYHYAFFVAPKNGQAPATKHHVKNTWQVDDSGGMTQPWRYENVVVTDISTELRLLARFVIAKVSASSPDQVQGILESVPVDNAELGAREFSCRTWIRDAFEELRRHGAITTGKLESWEDVQREALEYLEKKRRQGRWESSWKGVGGDIPLMDLIGGREVVE